MNALAGKKINPSMLPLGWTREEAEDGVDLHGVIPASRSLDTEELLQEGCIQIGGGPGPPVVLSATLRLDGDSRITDVEIYAYASHGPQFGRPIECTVTEEDEALVAAKVGRLLDPPEIVPGELVEDQAWLGKVIGRFNELSWGIQKLKNFFGGYVGCPVHPAALAPLGWDVDACFNGDPCCQGYIELITDLPQRFFLALELTPSKKGRIQEIRWFLKEENPPTSEDWDYPDCDGLVDGFNRLRLERVMATATGEAPDDLPAG